MSFSGITSAKFWQIVMVLYWSQYVFIFTNIVSFPLYLLIMVVCVKEYKHNPAQKAFNLLVISQGVMDILLMASYFTFGTLRLSELVNGFFWTYKDYKIAMWCYNQTYVSSILRCFGVLVISFQRYISLCKTYQHLIPLDITYDAVDRTNTKTHCIVGRRSYLGYSTRLCNPHFYINITRAYFLNSFSHPSIF
ncbi:unnamed protein product, partial [Haemonchus placei]